MASGEDPYVCALDEKTQKKAKDELNEDPKNRQGAIDTFREWIKQQKNIKCPTDNRFLLGFLRAKHFSQLEAREALERFMVHRDNLAIWTKNIDTADKEIVDIIDRGILLALPERDDEGRRVTIYTPGLLDASKKENIDACWRLFVATFYLNFLDDEVTQVHGTSYTYDGINYDLSNFIKLPISTRKGLGQLFSKAFPARVKTVHLCNPGPLLQMVISMFSKIFTEKMQKRVCVHSHGLESWYEHIPMKILPKEYLPDDYTGPNGGTVKDVKEHMKALLHKPEVRDRIKYLSSDEFYIDLTEKDLNAEVASFRQLKVD